MWSKVDHWHLTDLKLWQNMFDSLWGNGFFNSISIAIDISGWLDIYSDHDNVRLYCVKTDWKYVLFQHIWAKFERSVAING